MYENPGGHSPSAVDAHVCLTSKFLYVPFAVAVVTSRAFDRNFVWEYEEKQVLLVFGPAVFFTEKRGLKKKGLRLVRVVYAALFYNF